MFKTHTWVFLRTSPIKDQYFGYFRKFGQNFENSKINFESDLTNKFLSFRRLQRVPASHSSKK